MPPRFSITPVRAFEDTALKPAAFKVLVSLGAYADKRGYCYPSQSTLAKRLHVSRQAVNRQIKVLLDHGYLKIAHRNHPSGAVLSCLYQIQFEDPNMVKTKKGSEVAENRNIKSERESNLQNSHRINDRMKEMLLPTSESGNEFQKRKNQEKSGNEFTRDSQCLTLLDSAPETPDVSLPVTLKVSSPDTPDAAGHETTDVAQTTQLTTKITTRKNGKNFSTIVERPLNSTPSISGNFIEQQDFSPDEVSSLSSDMPTLDPENKAPGSTSITEPDSLTGFPEIPQDVGLHPDIRLYTSITNYTPPAWEIDAILLAIRTLRLAYPDDQTLQAFLIPLWQRWCASRRSNGARYSRTNSAWLTDWAINAVLRDTKVDLIESKVSSDLEVFNIAMEPKPEGCR